MKKLFILTIAVFSFVNAVFAQDAVLKIIEQPKPELPLKHGTLDVQGTVLLKVEFMDIGEIGEVTVVKQLTRDLDQKAIDAVRKIKFEPERKSGKAVSTIRTLEYSYSWNGGWRDLKRDDAANNKGEDPAKAEAVIAKAVQMLGGERYLSVSSQIGRGKYSIIKEGAVVSFQTFVDVIVFPDKERTEFKERGNLTIQTNSGETGWVYDGEQDIVKIQNETQLANFKQGMRTSLDQLLRGSWRGDAELSYIGRRPAALGKRNDAIKLIFKDGFVIEFEFSVDDGLPQKSLYKKTTDEGEEVKEEDRYAQFVDINGIKTPFIIDHITNGKPTSRINYTTVEFNKPIPDLIFSKPSTPKEAKKEIKI